MIVERLTFQAKYGQGDALVGLVREFNRIGASKGLPTVPRVYVDRTGPMFTVIWDSEHKDITAYAANSATETSMYSDPEFQAWFAKMMPLVERGERQLLEAIDL
ncbi:MAG: hypothetical protein C0506_14980 [Anaerolinea sp.]|nr:hypothetical protein [Anaerolinea sp.]